MRLFLTALVLLLVIEGSLFSAFPEYMRERLAELSQMPASFLRKAGITCLVLALLLGLMLRL